MSLHWVSCFACGTLVVALSFVASPSLAQGSDAFPCGGGFAGKCSIPDTGKRYKVSYGATDSYFHVSFQNIVPVICSQYTFGDPINSDNKPPTCRAIEFGKIPEEQTYRNCAKLGETCKVDIPEGQFVLARFGNPDGDQWVYNYVASNFDCNNSALAIYNQPFADGGSFTGVGGIDPAPGKEKFCQISAAVSGVPASAKAKKQAKWEVCATENEVCSLPTVGSYIIRYGARTRWYYREFYGSTFTCGNQYFYDPDAPADDVPKFCHYLSAPQIASISGGWQRLELCDNCSSIQYTFSEGVTEGEAKTTESSWSVEIGISLESGFGDNKVTTSINTTTGGAKSISDSFTQEAKQEKTITCDKGAVWQFTTTVEDYCAPSKPTCKTVASATIFRCTSSADQPNDNKTVALTAEEKSDWENRFPGKTAPATRKFWDPYP